MLQSLKIPVKRVSTLIGKEGAVKRGIESSTKTTLAVSPEGDVDIQGSLEGVLMAMDIAKAIGRGFSPGKAFLLLREENQLVTISLQGERETTIKRLLSRVIGRSGLAKRNIERLTGTLLCIYGKTISIIGDAENVGLASAAVEDLLEGRRHSFVYSKLEKRKRLEQLP